MSEFPPPSHTLGQPDPPREPYEGHHRSQPPSDLDAFGAGPAAAELGDRIASMRAGAARLAADGRIVLEPPFSPERDHYEGPPFARRNLVVFGAFGTPGAQALGRVLSRVRERYPAMVTVAWRHYPDPAAHPHATVLALAAEAAATRGRFWALTHELLAMRHDDPQDLHGALVRARVDPEYVREQMRAAAGADRIVDDVASALSSGVAYTPALFVDGERYAGELEPDAVLAEIDRCLLRPGSG
jgi:hypothetical protein